MSHAGDWKGVAFGSRSHSSSHSGASASSSSTVRAIVTSNSAARSSNTALLHRRCMLTRELFVEFKISARGICQRETLPCRLSAFLWSNLMRAQNRLGHFFFVMDDEASLAVFHD